MSNLPGIKIKAAEATIGIIIMYIKYDDIFGMILDRYEINIDMSNFYTEYDLPIITVRTRFFPRKTNNNSFYRVDPIVSYHSV